MRAITEPMLRALALVANYGASQPRRQNGWSCFTPRSYTNHGVKLATLRALYRRKLIDGCGCHQGTEGNAITHEGIARLLLVTEEQKRAWHDESLRRGMNPFCRPGKALLVPTLRRKP